MTESKEVERSRIAPIDTHQADILRPAVGVSLNTSWIDRTDMGRLHYVDEGKGSPIVMMHGTPTWSFLYRHPSQGYRCVGVAFRPTTSASERIDSMLKHKP